MPPLNIGLPAYLQCQSHPIFVNLKFSFQTFIYPRNLDVWEFGCDLLFHILWYAAAAAHIFHTKIQNF